MACQLPEYKGLPVEGCFSGTAHEKVRSWFASLDHMIATQDAEGLKGLFEEGSYWRDLLAFTWDIQTVEGKHAICQMLSETSSSVKPCNWIVEDVEEMDGVITAKVAFDTSCARCIGLVRLRQHVCWTMLTSAQELKGYDEQAGINRPLGQDPVARKGRESFIERQARKRAELGTSRQPYVVIVGGSQCGVVLGARLKMLGVPTIILEANAHAGDAWRNRYNTLCLHFPVSFCQTPYLPIPNHWPSYLSKDEMGDWIDIYAKAMDVDLWANCRCTRVEWSTSSNTWLVQVIRSGERLQLEPAHVVLAAGLNGTPYIPKLSQTGIFKGVAMHSSEYAGGSGYGGKKVVVVGSGTSAHDICLDLWEHGAEVTMLQRSATAIARRTTYQAVCVEKMYPEKVKFDEKAAESADLAYASLPYRLVLEKEKEKCEEMKALDADLLEQLDRVGFLLDQSEGCTNATNYLTSGSGTYLDVGASGLLADGSVKVKIGSVTGMYESGIVTKEGEKIAADLVVFATGYKPFQEFVAKLMSDDVAEKLGKVWGLGSGKVGDPGPWEGELRNMWKPTYHNRLWLHGGNLLQNRIYSLPLALQLKARHVGLQTLVYKSEKYSSRPSHAGA